jgi:hypothetical protein
LPLLLLSFQRLLDQDPNSDGIPPLELDRFAQLAA